MTHSQPIKVMIVEDNKLNRLGLKLRLEQIASFQLVGEACDGEQAVIKSLELHPDVILMDIGLPKLDGIEACRQIKNQLPQSRVVMLTLNEEPLTIQRCMDAGAHSFCLKDIDSESLAKAIRAAAGD